MKLSLDSRLDALAFLYDRWRDLPVWIRRLTPGQLEDIATVMSAWHASVCENQEILPLKTIEKREITRAISLFSGDVIKAARALRIGKTTVYRKLKEWGYSFEDRLLIHQASALEKLHDTSERSPYCDSSKGKH